MVLWVVSHPPVCVWARNLRKSQSGGCEGVFRPIHDLRAEGGWIQIKAPRKILRNCMCYYEAITIGTQNQPYHSRKSIFGKSGYPVVPPHVAEQEPGFPENRQWGGAGRVHHIQNSLTKILIENAPPNPISMVKKMFPQNVWLGSPL